MNCNCLCVMNHPGARGICTGTAETSLRFRGEIVGVVEVDMCSACGAATLADAPAETELARP